MEVDDMGFGVGSGTLVEGRLEGRQDRERARGRPGSSRVQGQLHGRLARVQSLRRLRTSRMLTSRPSFAAVTLMIALLGGSPAVTVADHFTNEARFCMTLQFPDRVDIVELLDPVLFARELQRGRVRIASIHPCALTLGPTPRLTPSAAVEAPGPTPLLPGTTPAPAESPAGD